MHSSAAKPKEIATFGLIELQYRIDNLHFSFAFLVFRFSIAPLQQPNHLALHSKDCAEIKATAVPKTEINLATRMNRMGGSPAQAPLKVESVNDS
jgi:hypothetical protein